MDFLDKSDLQIFVRRTIGSEENPVVVISGFMDKSGFTEDFVDYAHKSYALVFVLRGEGHYVDASGKKYLLKKGSWFQRFPNIRHSTYIKPKSGWVEFFIDLPEIYFKALEPLSYFSQNVPVGANMDALGWISDFEEIIHTLKDKTDTDCQYVIPKMIDLQMRIIKGRQNQFAEYEHQNAAVVEKACTYFSKNVATRFSIRDYCADQRLGYEKFRKDFVKIMNISPSKYCVRRRLDKCAELLQRNNPVLSIESIAAQMGYNSAYEFSAQFKRMHGLSPKKYRMRHS